MYYWNVLNAGLSVGLTGFYGFILFRAVFALIECQKSPSLCLSSLQIPIAVTILIAILFLISLFNLFQVFKSFKTDFKFSKWLAFNIPLYLIAVIMFFLVGKIILSIVFVFVFILVGLIRLLINKQSLNK